MVGVQQTIQEENIVKREIVLLMSIIALSAAGCQKKEEPAKALAPQAMMQPAAPQTGPHPPFAAAPGSNPHAGLPSGEIPSGAAVHKGKVVQTMDASSYTYVEVEEKGEKLWLAVMKTAVKKGDIVEFPDSPPMVNFTSKTLNRTFDKIIFAQALRVVK